MKLATLLSVLCLASLAAAQTVAPPATPVPLLTYPHDLDGGGRTYSGVLTVGSGTRVHNWVFTSAAAGSGNPVVIGNGATNVQIDHNSFSQVAGGGITGYPGNDLIITVNSFDYVYEPVHVFAGRGTVRTLVASNTITHATRFAIEMQEPFSDLTIGGNRVSDWLRNPGDSAADRANPNADSHIALSIAVGGWKANNPDNPTPGVDYPGGRRIEIAGNVLLASGPQQQLNSWAKFAIEVMGGDVSLHDNYIAQGWGGGFLLGNDGTVISKNNVAVGCGNYGLYAEGDSTPWPVPPILKAGGDQLFAAGDPKAPPVPAAPASQPSSVASAPPATQPASHAATHSITVFNDGSISLDGK